jgi:hypothetical protein
VGHELWKISERLKEIGGTLKEMLDRSQNGEEL